jgi:hypothetical protein
MARTTKIVLIPKPAPEAFNKNRAAGQLLRAQTVHLRHALLKHLQEVVALLVVDPASLKTEGQVSAYAKQVMHYLHPHGSKPRERKEA